MTPIDEAGVVAAVRDATGTLCIRGAGSKLPMLRPVRAASSLSTAGLTGITLYSPKELVLSARAGTPLAELVAATAAEGQHLIAEPPNYRRLLGTDAAGTIGGAVATNLSGPRRVAWGAMRDHVLGVRAVIVCRPDRIAAGLAAVRRNARAASSVRRRRAGATDQ